MGNKDARLVRSERHASMVRATDDAETKRSLVFGQRYVLEWADTHKPCQRLVKSLSQLVKYNINGEQSSAIHSSAKNNE